MTLHRFATAIGKGFIAGVLGTAAVTVSQRIEMRITGRKKSLAPAKIGGKVLGVQPKSPTLQKRFSEMMHWEYGTNWGLFLTLEEIVGLGGIPGSLLHFAALWGTALTILPVNGLAKPITERDAKSIAIDAMHHAFYAAVAGLVYRGLSEKRASRSQELLASERVARSAPRTDDVRLLVP